MKRLIPFVLVIAVVLAVVPLAAGGKPGGGGWAHGKAKFNLVGTVTAVSVADPASVSTITIKVKAGTKTIRGLRGLKWTFNVADDAPVWLLTEDGRVAMTLGDVAAGDKVKARGTITRVGDDLVYTIKNLKYHDLTPDEVTPPVTL